MKFEHIWKFRFDLSLRLQIKIFLNLLRNLLPYFYANHLFKIWPTIFFFKMRNVGPCKYSRPWVHSIYLWAQGAQVAHVVRITNVTRKARTKLFQKLHSCCSSWLLRDPIAIGGHGLNYIVEIDECQLHQRQRENCFLGSCCNREGLLYISYMFPKWCLIFL